MLQNDRIPQLRKKAAERMVEELAALIQLHKSNGKLFEKHGFEEAQYIENYQAGIYESYSREMKSMNV